jgi:uncharacterized protein (DUF1015 family)
LKRVSENFSVNKVSDQEAKPKQFHEISMYVSGSWYRLIPKADKYRQDHAVQSLDTAILTDLLLEPILDIKDLKTDERVDFVSGNRGVKAITDSVNGGKIQSWFCVISGFSRTVKACCR